MLTLKRISVNISTMKRTLKLTNDNYKSKYGISDGYYCEKNRNDGFRLCVDEVNRLFPQTVGKDVITLTMSTVRKHKCGEVTVRLNHAAKGHIPHVVIRGEYIQILEQTRYNIGLPIRHGDAVFVTIDA